MSVGPYADYEYSAGLADCLYRVISITPIYRLIVVGLSDGGPVNLYVNSDHRIFLRELSMQKGGFLDFNINKYIYMI